MSAQEIKTFVFLDLETTGLPWQERNLTKIIELCVIAASREDILLSATYTPFKKLSFLLNPQREIHPEVTRLTGLSQANLKDCPVFEDNFEAFKKFLKALPRPLCLVAHNGYLFDYPILRAEVRDAKRRLPSDIYCTDSLVAFRQLDRTTVTPLSRSYVANISSGSSVEEWPELDVSTEDWEEIDDLCERLSDVSTDPDSPQKPKKQRVSHGEATRSRRILQENISSKQLNQSTEKKLYNLSALYKRIVQKEPIDAHRAESDCRMLLECVAATKHDFLPWADQNWRLLSKIKPLQRNKCASSRKTY